MCSSDLILAEVFDVHLIKMDLLSLGMLSAIGRCFDHVASLTGERLELHGFRYDPRVYDQLCEADTVGLFQVESRAQQSFLPRWRPRNLADVAISVGAIRPGPGAARAGEGGLSHVSHNAQHESLSLFLMGELLQAAAHIGAGVEMNRPDPHGPQTPIRSGRSWAIRCSCRTSW